MKDNPWSTVTSRTSREREGASQTIGSSWYGASAPSAHVMDAKRPAMSNKPGNSKLSLQFFLFYFIFIIFSPSDPLATALSGDFGFGCLSWWTSVSTLALLPTIFTSRFSLTSHILSSVLFFGIGEWRFFRLFTMLDFLTSAFREHQDAMKTSTYVFSLQ